jgi:hypothetical protein
MEGSIKKFNYKLNYARADNGGPSGCGRTGLAILVRVFDVDRMGDLPMELRG